METLSNLIQTNLIVIQFSIGLMVLLFLIRFFTNVLVIFFITLIFSYNVYFFTLLNDQERVEHKTYIKKAIDYNNEFIAKSDVLKTMSADTQKLLETNKIVNQEDLEKYLSQTLQKNKIK